MIWQSWRLNYEPWWINFAYDRSEARAATQAPRFHVGNIDDVFTLQHEPGIDTSPLPSCSAEPGPATCCSLLAAAL